MSFRFARVTNYYPQYLSDYYTNNPDESRFSYNEQYIRLVNHSFDSASSYSKQFNKVGIPAMDVISNAEILQNTWRKENNFHSGSVGDLIIAQLSQFNPTVVWVDDFSLINQEWKENLLKKIPELKLLVGHICAPYNSQIEEKLRLFDLVFSCIPCMTDELKQKGFNAHLLYHSFDETILQEIKQDNNQPETEFLFSGSLYSGAGFHNERMKYVQAFIDNGFPISVYANLESASRIIKKKLLRSFLLTMKKAGMSSLIDNISFLRDKKSYVESPVMGYSKQILGNLHSPVFGMSLFSLMQKADITFNIHGEIAGNCAGNMRMFEVTGVGSCLLTDHKDNITDLFIPGTEIVTYTDLADCLKKVKWLLDHPEERKKIAKKGRERTLRDHTVGNRIKKLDEIIEKELLKK